MPVVIAGVVVLVATFSIRSRVGYAIGWLIILFAVGWVVSGEGAPPEIHASQRYDAVAERLTGSVNMGFIELAQSHPFGNGLGGGGTSMPYWIQQKIRIRS